MFTVNLQYNANIASRPCHKNSTQHTCTCSRPAVLRRCTNHSAAAVISSACSGRADMVGIAAKCSRSCVYTSLLAMANSKGVVLAVAGAGHPPGDKNRIMNKNITFGSASDLIRLWKCLANVSREFLEKGSIGLWIVNWRSTNVQPPAMSR